MNSLHLDTPPLSTKTLALPTTENQRTFEEIAGMILMDALLGSSVCVVCLTDELLARWLKRLDGYDVPITLLDALNSNWATLTDWRAFLGGQPHDVTLLHGVMAEMKANRLSLGYVKHLVEAVPAGLVVIA